jgi:hypothetical protein
MAVTFAAILNKLADLDYEIIRLEAERAQHVSDANQIARLDEVIGRLYRTKESLRADFRRRHARSQSHGKKPT